MGESDTSKPVERPQSRQSPPPAAKEKPSSREAELEQKVESLKLMLAEREKALGIAQAEEHAPIKETGPKTATFVVTGFGFVSKAGKGGSVLLGKGKEIELERSRAIEINRAGPYLVEKGA